MITSKYDIISTMFSGKKQLPTLPSIFQNFNKVMNSPAVSSRKVADLIMKDQSMVVKILRLCNSAIYGRMKETTSLTDAINFLGFETLRRIILQLSLIKMFKFNIAALPEFSVTTVWEHSIATAHFADALAQKLRLQRGGQFYLGGLLHDIGKVLIYEFYPKRFVEIVTIQVQENIPDFRAEQRVLQADHTDIGAFVAEEWKFEKELVNAIGNHHSELKSRGSKTTALVTLANLLARAGGLTFSWDSQDVDLMGNEAWHLLLPQAGPEEIEKVVFELLGEVDAIRRIVKEFVW